MCGIAGIIDHSGVNTADLKRLSLILKHRGPDDEGYLLSDADFQISFLRGDDSIPELQKLDHISNPSSSGVPVLGMVHRRLSILDLSAKGHQPMSFHNYHIVFNGEIYNYRELSSELITFGYNFTTESDTEVILAAYDKWGKNCVTKFVGMWAFALFDAGNKIFFLSRDRFGIKPLYYFYENGKFAFASEIKALLALDFIKPQADMSAVNEYIAFGSTSDPSANLFKHISVVPPSCNLILNTGTLDKKLEIYYDLEKNVKETRLPAHEKIQSHFQYLFANSIDLHLRSDVPVGSALSGGLDSSTLVAIATGKINGKTFKTFTAAYHEKNIDESAFAKKVIAGSKNIEGHFAYPGAAGYWSDLEKFTWHQDLPVNSTSMYAQWEIMKLAHKEKIKVLLDGQGADEILGGYYNFAGIYLIELLQQFNFKQFLSEKKALTANFSPDIRSTIGKAAYYFLPASLQRSVRAKRRLGFNFFTEKDLAGQIKIPARGGRSFRQQSILSIKFGMQDLLRYEDRNSMAFSIESRVPFLDHRVVEFCIALNNDWKIKAGWTKYILRKCAEPMLDKDVVWRKYKMGFLTPQKEWKDRSQKELNEFINGTNIPAFLDKNYILRLNSTELKDTSRLSEYWKIISFLKWAQIFKVNFN